MDVQQLYSARFESQKVLDRKQKIWQVLCKHFFQKHIPTDGVVLDIAAGYCEFINNIEAKKKIAFDLNPDVKRFANKDVQVFNESFFDMTKHLRGAQADIIFASNILEHLDSKEQVISAIKVCAEALKPAKMLNNVMGGGGQNVNFTTKYQIHRSRLLGFYRPQSGIDGTGTHRSRRNVRIESQLLPAQIFALHHKIKNSATPASDLVVFETNATERFFNGCAIFFNFGESRWMN
ncbi:hypothetical protein AGMMS49965_23130 [Bacteroidia bacterium]|nr:hypothetical protein AGMMS49965_23130 [Bacteroidia bacterium]